MGDDIKISNSNPKKGTDFLPEEIKDVDGAVEVYSLEDEFAKTKKTKNFKLYLALLLFVTAILGFAWLFTNYIGSKGRNVPLDIREFEDLRLKEVLQSTRFFENRIEVISIRIQELRIAKLNEILDERKKSLGAELDVIAENISNDEKEKKVKQLREQEARHLRWIRARYNGKIRRQKSRMYTLEDQMIKEKKLIEEKKKQGLMTNEDRLNSMKMRNLRKSRVSSMNAMQKYHESYSRYLVLKYNPVFRSERLKAILENRAYAEDPPAVDFREYSDLLKKKDIFTPERFKKLRTMIEDDLLLVERLKNIPNVNSVAPSLKRIDFLNRKIAEEYEFLWGSLYKQYALYHNAVQKFLEGSKVAQGILLDVSNEQKMQVHLQSRENVTQGKVATVIRGREEKYIGTVEFVALTPHPLARIVEKKEAFAPFDVIVFVEAKALEKIKAKK